jgi:hypothetical protein
MLQGGLSSAENTLFPNQQVRGLLIELALKTYICASGKVSWGHYLKALIWSSKNGHLVKLL